MLKKKSLSILHGSNGDVIRRLVHYTITNISLRAIGLFSLPILTRIFTVKEFGVYSTYLALVSMVAVVLGLNFPQAVMRYYYEDKDDFQDFIRSMSNFMILIFASFCVLAFCFSNFVLDYFKVTIDIFYASILSALGIAALNIYFKKIVAIGDSKKVAVVSGINNIGTLICSLGVTLLIVPHSIYIFIWTSTFTKIILFVFLIYQLDIFSKRFYIYKIHLQYAFSFSLPRWIFTASILLLNQFDRLMLNNIQGLESTAIYSVAYNIGMLVTLVIAAVSPSITPNYFKLLKEENGSEIDRLNILLSLITLFLSLCLIFISPFLLKIVAPNGYQGAESIIPIIIYGYVIHSFSSIYGRIFDYVKKAKYLSMVSLAALLLNVFLNFFWIKKYGYIGAAYATTISFLFMLLLLWYFSKFKIKIHTTNILFFIFPCVIFFLFSFFYGYINSTNSKIIYSFIGLVIIAVSYFKYYKYLLSNEKFN